MKTFKIIGFILLCLKLNCAFAQLSNDAGGARAVSMGNASIANTDVWAVQNNIAALSTIEGTYASAFFQNRMGMEGFNTSALAAVHQLKKGVLGVNFKRFGDNAYNEQVIGLGAAHQLEFVSLGVKANLMQVSIEGLGTRRGVALEIGGLVHLNDEITFGANVYNFNRVKMAEYVDERFSTVLKAGFLYKPFDVLSASLELEKDVDFRNNIKAGLEYFIMKKFCVRTGISTINQQGNFGFGIKLSRFDVDYALGFSNRLGISNAVSLNYIIRQIKTQE